MPTVAEIPSLFLSGDAAGYLLLPPHAWFNPLLIRLLSPPLMTLVLPKFCSPLSLIGPTTVNVRITGLTPGLSWISPRAHFNPNNLTHGAPEDEVRHAGDLGNIVANANGVAEATIVDNQIPLSGPNSVVGRALVVHELEDDLGKGGHELS
ncbi:hypothetical protein PIB30_005831 [Stylosanthes scabra]|uniref:Superoxide dismutase copper/zinc binding domain-containing protein n=1 Tax=Stylosanthes scabra TaxID=79078 RepID=A0ABU6Y2Y7_9FABA|nr:hypothetical protein [Stylosanthes scabra]